MFKTSKSANEIVNQKGLSQVSDTKEIEKIVDNILNLNLEKIKEYKKGKTKLLSFFVGESMKVSKGKINPKILNELLVKKLNSYK